MSLSLTQRFKLHVRQPVLAALGIGGNVALRLEETPEGTSVLVEGRRVFVPAALCWKYYRQGWQGRLERLAQEYGVGTVFPLDESSIVLDIGANSGEFAHLCARHRARVISFEPDPSVYDCLVRNMRGTPGIETHDFVVWNKDGEIAFGLAPERHDSSVFASQAPTALRPARRLDTFAAERGLDRATLLKCDAEGAEPEVLEGAGEFLRSVNYVSVDTGAERNGARTNKECASILEDKGFEVRETRVGTRLMTYGFNRMAR